MRRTKLRLFPPLRVLREAFDIFASLRFRGQHKGTLPFVNRQMILNLYNQYCAAADYFRSELHIPSHLAPELKKAL
jgi:hypothetical protein